MVSVSKRTEHLCKNRGAEVLPTVNGHGGVFRCGNIIFVKTKEGLGNKAWIAMLLDHLDLSDPTGQYHFGGLGFDMFLMGGNDCAAHGGHPTVVTDEVSCGSSEFFTSPQAKALAASFERACFMAECSLIQGESPTYVYLMKSEPPVKYAPSMSVDVLGIASRYISGEAVRPGDVIIGFPSSGLHSNGISPVIRRVMQLKEGFLTPLNGWTVGQEALIPTRSYIGLTDALLVDGIDVHAFLPMTGDGIGKFASDPRYHYRIDNWLPEDQWPPLFRFMLEIGMPKRGVAETFNCGIGFAAIVPPSAVQKVFGTARTTFIDGDKSCSRFYEPYILGEVEEGKAGTHFVPWDLELPPPGE